MGSREALRAFVCGVGERLCDSMWPWLCSGCERSSSHLLLLPGIPGVEADEDNVAVLLDDLVRKNSILRPVSDRLVARSMLLICSMLAGLVSDGVLDESKVINVGVLNSWRLDQLKS